MIETRTDTLGVSKWNLDIVIAGQANRFSPAVISDFPFYYMRFWVPEDLIPPGPFWFQIEYKVWAYSDWVTSGDMTMLAPPTDDYEPRICIDDYTRGARHRCT